MPVPTFALRAPLLTEITTGSVFSHSVAVYLFHVPYCRQKEAFRKFSANIKRKTQQQDAFTFQGWVTQQTYHHSWGQTPNKTNIIVSKISRQGKYFATLKLHCHWLSKLYQADRQRCKMRFWCYNLHLLTRISLGTRICISRAWWLLQWC